MNYDTKLGRFGSQKVRAVLLRIYGRRCQYCHNIFEDQKLIQEHIDPRSKGGPDVATNITLACIRCNALKKDEIFPEPGRSMMLMLAQRKAQRILTMLEAMTGSSLSKKRRQRYQPPEDAYGSLEYHLPVNSRALELYHRLLPQASWANNKFPEFDVNTPEALRYRTAVLSIPEDSELIEVCGLDRPATSSPQPDQDPYNLAVQWLTWVNLAENGYHPLLQSVSWTDDYRVRYVISHSSKRIDRATLALFEHGKELESNKHNRIWFDESGAIIKSESIRLKAI
jgi:hypothetical protein